MNKFIVVGTQRTGSSAFAELISLHPTIACGWEWTQHINPLAMVSTAKKSLNGDFKCLSSMHREHMSTQMNSDITHLGFRRLFRASDSWIFKPSISITRVADRLDSHLQWIASNSDIKIIHIVRNNNFDWISSKFVSKETGLYVGESYKENTVVDVDIDQALKRVKAKLWLDNKLKDLRKTNPYHVVLYEEFKKNNISNAKKAIEFLGVKGEVSLSGVQKIKPQSAGGGININNKDMLLNSLELSGLLNQGFEE